MRFIRGCIAGVLIYGVFWFAYTQTGQIGFGIGITAVIGIGVMVALRRMAKGN